MKFEKVNVLEKLQTELGLGVVRAQDSFANLDALFTSVIERAVVMGSAIAEKNSNRKSQNPLQTRNSIITHHEYNIASIFMIQNKEIHTNDQHFNPARKFVAQSLRLYQKTPNTA